MLANALDALARPDVQAVFANNLVPAAEQILLACTIKPQLAAGWPAIGLGIDPLAFRKVLDGVGDLAFLEYQDAQPRVLGSKRRVQAGRAGADHNYVENIWIATAGVRLGRNMRGDVVSLLHRQFHYRRAGEIPNDVDTRNVTLKVGAQHRPTRRHVRAFKYLVQELEQPVHVPP